MRNLLLFFFGKTHFPTMMISFKTLFQKTGHDVKQSEKQKRNHKKTKVTKVSKEENVLE